MAIVSVTYRRKWNTGNFTSFDLEATATIDDNHDPRAVALALQSYVDELGQQRLDAGKRGARGGQDTGEGEPWDV